MASALILVFALTILTVTPTADAEQAGKVFRIGILGTTAPTDPDYARVWNAFFRGLRELGYEEGRNITIDWRISEGKAERFPALAAELVRLKVDVIVAAGSQSPHAAKDATKTIPVVITNHADPVGSGLVASLPRPGGKITGLSYLSVELVGKQLQPLKEAVPKASRVAILSNPATPAHALGRREAEDAARLLGVQLQTLEVSGPDELHTAFAAMSKERAGALLVRGDPGFFFYRKMIADLLAKSRLPAMFALREHAEAGGLMAYGPSLQDNLRRAATYVDKILKGAKPADLPVEQPMRFELVINLRSAKALGLTMPQSILIQATEVIQ